LPIHRSHTDAQGDRFVTGNDVVLEFASIPKPTTPASLLAVFGAFSLIKLRRQRRTL
jgi:hypothetical protein